MRPTRPTCLHPSCQHPTPPSSVYPGGNRLHFINMGAMTMCPVYSIPIAPRLLLLCSDYDEERYRKDGEVMPRRTGVVSVVKMWERQQWYYFFCFFHLYHHPLRSAALPPPSPHCLAAAYSPSPPHPTTSVYITQLQSWHRGGPPRDKIKMSWRFSSTIKWEEKSCLEHQTTSPAPVLK